MAIVEPLLPQYKNSPETRRSWKRTILTCLILFILVSLYISPTSHKHHHKRHHKKHKKNVIFFVTDGMGPASISMARSWRQYRDNLDYSDTLFLDENLIGSSRTRSSSSLITDSAAGANAFSCALKSYNGAIGVDPFKNPCGTVLEGAKMMGYRTGMVVTTRITDATPAAFSSHVDFRYQEDQIAEQQIGLHGLGSMVDVMIGGGRMHYYGSNITQYGNGGVRADGLDLIGNAISKGWSYVGNRAEFDNLDGGRNVSLPLLALLADGDIPYDIDRDNAVYPSLEEQALVAVRALTEATENSDEGFFLLIEGSRIDHAGHANDAHAQVREVLAFDKTFQAIKEYIDDLDTETVMISTSDHETGGLVTAKQLSPDYPEYVWYPEVLNNATHSGEFLTRKIWLFDGQDKSQFVRDIIENDLGISDYTEEDVIEILEAKLPNTLNDKINSMVYNRAQIGWTTHGHSAVDVNIYAYANKKSAMHLLYEKLAGNHENTEIGQFMADYMGINLHKVTKHVKNVEHGPRIQASEMHTDEYHHYF